MKAPTHNTQIAITVLLSLAAIGGCGDSPPAQTACAMQPAPAPAQSASMAPIARDDQPQIGTIVVSQEILAACTLSSSAARFAFDSSRVKADDDGWLDAVAGCFSSGALRGRTLKVVGHADPRGTYDYNQTLGQRRADSISNYLQGHGLAQVFIRSSSRGAVDAIGADEMSWARDRRVDLTIAL